MYGFYPGRYSWNYTEKRWPGLVKLGEPIPHSVDAPLITETLRVSRHQHKFDICVTQSYELLGLLFQHSQPVQTIFFNIHSFSTLNPLILMLCPCQHTFLLVSGAILTTFLAVRLYDIAQQGVQRQVGAIDSLVINTGLYVGVVQINFTPPQCNQTSTQLQY